MCALFFLCNTCNRLAHESATNVWLVDHRACCCIFLPTEQH